jgi:hypothetical protein
MTLLQHDKQIANIHVSVRLDTDKSETSTLDRSATLVSGVEHLIRQTLSNFSNSSQHIRLKPSTITNTIYNRIYDRSTLWLENLKGINHLGTHMH